VTTLRQRDQKSIAQSRRLRGGTWSSVCLPRHTLPRPLARLQRLSWTDPSMHRVRIHRARLKCEWKHGERPDLRQRREVSGEAPRAVCASRTWSLRPVAAEGRHLLRPRRCRPSIAPRSTPPRQPLNCRGRGPPRRPPLDRRGLLMEAGPSTGSARQERHRWQ
jgi:hypothetical protein